MIQVLLMIFRWVSSSQGDRPQNAEKWDQSRTSELLNWNPKRVEGCLKYTIPPWYLHNQKQHIYSDIIVHFRPQQSH